MAKTGQRTTNTVAAPTAQTQLAPPAGGTGAAAGGWDTAGNRDLGITSITAGRTDVGTLITELTNLRAALVAKGIL